MTHPTPYHACSCGRTHRVRASWERLPLDGYSRGWVGNPDQPDDLDDPTHRVFEYRTCSCGSTRTAVLPFDLKSKLQFKEVTLTVEHVGLRRQRLANSVQTTLADPPGSTGVVHLSDHTWCSVSDLLAAIEAVRVSVKPA